MTRDFRSLRTITPLFRCATRWALQVTPSRAPYSSSVFHVASWGQGSVSILKWAIHRYAPSNLEFSETSIRNYVQSSQWSRHKVQSPPRICPPKAALAPRLRLLGRIEGEAGSSALSAQARRAGLSPFLDADSLPATDFNPGIFPSGQVVCVPPTRSKAVSTSTPPPRARYPIDSEVPNTLSLDGRRSTSA